MFDALDPLFLSEYRLSIMTILYAKSQAEFTDLKNLIAISPGNLSLQLAKLKSAQYIEVKKQFKGNYPLTLCKITQTGKIAVDDFFKSLETYRNYLSQSDSIKEPVYYNY